MGGFAATPESWIQPRPKGLYVIPGDFYVDPTRVVDTAIITHGHGDHARPGHRRVAATPETLAIMEVRLGRASKEAAYPLLFGEILKIGDVSVWLAPAGHILGSAQVVLEHRGSRVVISGDYKRRRDPTCAGFEPVACDVFVTEATFGLPVFRHPDDAGEIRKLLHSLVVFPDRCHVVGAYSLGKAQRVIALLREIGYDRPIYLHESLHSLCALYTRFGIALGDLRPLESALNAASAPSLAGEIVLAPPSSNTDLEGGRIPDPLVVGASGWMRVKKHTRQRGTELRLVISDHADWDELFETFRDVRAPEIWVTHGREDAIMHQAELEGFKARALRLVGYGEERT
ncbi:MAG: ligase-associated DNA damage response exonuclease [Alphaproteobacteria bacterium]|nr:ligase-associated DNA damage response exonuclease [Alphaproteobacteria bacterium]